MLHLVFERASVFLAHDLKNIAECVPGMLLPGIRSYNAGAIEICVNNAIGDEYREGRRHLTYQESSDMSGVMNIFGGVLAAQSNWPIVDSAHYFRSIPAVQSVLGLELG